MRLLLLLCAATSALAANWALLVAGSNEYYNYRHQADVCHSYHVLVDNGFDPQNIVMMFYDDIANNEENPFKGNMINQPNGPNVYTGCVADYSKDDVTPQNFLKVLSGASMNGVGSGRVINSTENDNIFVFFSDHGATGLIAFPSDELMADDLIATLKGMYNNQQYKQMLFYLEACESGSMFNDLLPTTWNILAVTASTPFESSYAIYFDDSRDTYLGDVFSVFWMQDSEAKEQTETVREEFVTVRNETTESRVCSYGDSSIMAEMLSIFQSAPKSLEGTAQPVKESGAIRVSPDGPMRRPLVPRGMSRSAPAREKDMGQIVDARDVELLLARNMAKKLGNTAAGEVWRKKALSITQRRETQDARMMFVMSEAQLLVNSTKFVLANEFPKASSPCKVQTVVSDYACLKKMVRTVKEACGPFDHYSLRHVSLLNQFCNSGINPEALKPTIVAACFA